MGNAPKKVALLFICLNEPYWQFAKDVIEDCRKNFLPGHQVDYFLWSDMPEIGSKEYTSRVDSAPPQEHLNNILKQDFFDFCAAHLEMDFGQCFQTWSQNVADRANEINKITSREKLQESIDFLRSSKDIHIIPTEPVTWPYPTLMRYHLFLNEEERLKDYDYIFYMDLDMRVVDIVGDEILGDELTMAEHPMYALRREYIPPYEPNRNSAAYVPRLGCVLTDELGKQYFKPLYAAGGFQGGTSQSFIKAMKVMKENIDKDFTNNYVAIWNDESHWNKYLYGYSGNLVVLSPSYVYPDSLIEEYYVKVWGRNYPPKIITLTKKFTTSAEAGVDLRKRLQTM